MSEQDWQSLILNFSWTNRRINIQPRVSSVKHYSPFTNVMISKTGKFFSRRYSHIPGPKRESFIYGNAAEFRKYASL